MCTGCLIGEDDANQVLQADINADPTTRLTAAALYQDSSAWLSKALAARSPHPAEPDPREAESAHDQLIEVEDGGLEGGQVPGEQVRASHGPHMGHIWATHGLQCHHLAVLLTPPSCLHL